MLISGSRAAHARVREHIRGALVVHLRHLGRGGGNGGPALWQLGLGHKCTQLFEILQEWDRQPVQEGPLLFCATTAARGSDSNCGGAKESNPK